MIKWKGPTLFLVNIFTFPSFLRSMASKKDLSFRAKIFSGNLINIKWQTWLLTALQWHIEIWIKSDQILMHHNDMKFNLGPFECQSIGYGEHQIHTLCYFLLGMWLWFSGELSLWKVLLCSARRWTTQTRRLHPFTSATNFWKMSTNDASANVEKTSINIAPVLF